MRFGWTKSTAVMAVAIASLLAPLASARAEDGIVATRVNGHVVYVNNDEAHPSAAASAEPAAFNPQHPARRLEYWSNTEQRWKPVPHPTHAAMTAARSAAQEVASFVGSKPAMTNNAKAVTDPNFRDLARGHAVTSAEVDKAITEAAARHQVDPNLVRAVIKVESNFNPRALSKKGAMGLMQLMPATARSLNVTNPFDPAQNVDAGVRHLKSLLNNFGGNIPLSLAAYNAGERAVLKHNAVPEFAETKSYVRQITNIYTGGAPLSQMRSVSRGTPMRVYRAADGTLRLSNEE
jgi:soluble lytic murein transglycosylase-like protein